MSKKVTEADCAGCRNDFYNGRQNIGGNQCWSLKNATFVEKVEIHIDQPPPYKGLKAKTVPNCYHKARYVMVSPDRIGSDGYWK